MKRLSVLVLASAILAGCADYGPKEMGGSPGPFWARSSAAAPAGRSTAQTGST